MRATSMRRLVGGTASLMLIGTMLLSATGSALAADTRFLYVGPDPAFSTGTNDTLTFTPVTVGGDALSTIYVHNIDNQTLTHVVITIVKSQNGATVSGSVLGPDAAKCDGTIDPITCDFGNLKAGATRQFSIVVNAGAASSLISAHIVFNESTNPNGGNTQIDNAFSTLTAGAASCNTLATFLPPGVASKLVPNDGTACVNDGQRSGLIVPAAANGNIVQLDDSQSAAGCPTGFACIGNTVDGNVNNGAPVSPYLKWTIFYSNATLGSVNPNKVAFIHDGTIIAAGNKGLCKNATSTNCQEPFVVDPTGVTFTVRTPTNGLIKGMH